jgi:hypothetical protein
MRRYLNMLINSCTSCTPSRKSTELKTIEYWSKREPYRSSTRAFGHIELMNPVETPQGPRLAVRGWIFDIHSRLTNLRITNPHGESGTTVSNLTRDDVVTNMRSFKHSRTSGFVSLLPLRTEINDFQLHASYHASGEQINIVFERTPVSLGITAPGTLIATSTIELSSIQDYVAVVVHSKLTPDVDMLDAVVREHAPSTTNFVVFSDLPRDELDKASSAAAWHRRINGNLADATGTLLRYRKTLRKIVLVGPAASELLHTHVLPVLAHSPTPPLSWIPSVQETHSCMNTIRLDLPGKVLEL